MKIIFALLFISSTCFAMVAKGERVSKLTFLKDKNVYEVVILNKAAFYKADEKILPCLQKGLKEKIDLEIDPMNLTITACK